MGFSSSGGGGEQLQSYLSPDELHCWGPRPLTSQAKPRFLWSSARQRLPGRFSKSLISPAAGLSFLPGTVDVHALSASAYFRDVEGWARCRARWPYTAEKVSLHGRQPKPSAAAPVERVTSAAEVTGLGSTVCR